MIYLIYGLIFLFIILWALSIFRHSSCKPTATEEKEYIKGLEFLIEGRKKEAMEFFKKAFEKNQDNASAYLRLGDLQREMGNPEKALRIHQNLLVKPGLAGNEKNRVIRSIVEDYKAQGRFKEASNYIKKLIRTGIRDISLHKDLLKFYEEMEDWTSAREEKYRVLSLEKQDIKKGMAAYCLYISIRLIDKSLDKSKNFLRCAEKYDRYNSFIHYVRGEIAYKEDNKDKAIEEWKTFIKDVPRFGYLAGPKIEELLYEKGRFNEAEKLYEEILEKSPEETEVLLLYTNILIKEGKYDRAKDILEQAYENNPKKAIITRLFRIYKKTDKKKVLNMLDGIEGMLEFKPKYKCMECGNETDEFSWKCNNCGAYFTLTRMYE